MRIKNDHIYPWVVQIEASSIQYIFFSVSSDKNVYFISIFFSHQSSKKAKFLWSIDHQTNTIMWSVTKTDHCDLWWQVPIVDQPFHFLTNSRMTVYWSRWLQMVSISSNGNINFIFVIDWHFFTFLRAHKLYISINIFCYFLYTCAKVATDL